MKNVLLALLPLVLAAPLAQAQRRLPLYSGVIPNATPSAVQEITEKASDGSERVRQVVQPELVVYRAPLDKANGTAVIICPGGGYESLSMGKEGYQVAERLNELGVTAFVLKYRLPNDAAQPDKTQAPLLDAQQAVRLVRQQAAQFNVQPTRIGLLGFSAGGHLAASAGTHFAQPLGPNPGTTSVRPDFLVLVYPVITMADSLTHAGSRTRLLGATPSAEQVKLYSGELQVSAQTPPTFLVHAQDDKSVPVQNSLLFYQACLHHAVPAEMHLYPKGGHGFGLRNATTKDDWMERLHNWLDANGWLTR
ncbi:alpha/beta hydrolase [Hymenobacter actinosclerus]|uniref:Acetyl esterase/lipase n=1 Tax=Hymenobacter actinosclerus TaxID=82805 RepID=A0A1I0DGD8_9BACT|nr:alpha/beta hydrolase [Hymenobacter actinosclerus]SET31346.1 Acetyl esterase/lipase [Hymenobacter actinosclerus]